MNAIFQALITYGPLGIFAAWLMIREQRRERRDQARELEYSRRLRELEERQANSTAQALARTVAALHANTAAFDRLAAALHNHHGAGHTIPRRTPERG